MEDERKFGRLCPLVGLFRHTFAACALSFDDRRADGSSCSPSTVRFVRVEHVTGEQAISAARFSIARRAAIARGLLESPRAATSARHRNARPRSASVAFKANAESVRTFAQQVALATTGPCLRYSQRLQLFDLANEAGISRFDANLIIAAIEHRAGKSRTDVEAETEKRSLARPSILLSTAAAVQLAIVFAGWIMLMR